MVSNATEHEKNQSPQDHAEHHLNSERLATHVREPESVLAELVTSPESPRTEHACPGFITSDAPRPAKNGPRVLTTEEKVSGKIPREVIPICYELVAPTPQIRKNMRRWDLAFDRYGCRTLTERGSACYNCLTRCQCSSSRSRCHNSSPVRAS